MNTPLNVVCPACGVVNRVPRERAGAGPKCGKCHQALFSGEPIPLTSGNFERQVLRSGIPVLVDFWAPWCGPCRAMAPAFEQAAATLEPRVRLAKLNTDEEQQLAARFGIRSIPTMILFEDGREVARQSGALPGGAIEQWVKRTLRAVV